MKFTLLLKASSVLFFLFPVMHACDPAEEGKPYTLKYVMAAIPSYTTVVMWTKDDVLVAECAVVAGDCVTNDIGWLTAKVENNGDSLLFIVHINSVSRQLLSNAKGIWKLRTHTTMPGVEVFYHCNLQVYAKPRDTECTKTLSKDGLTVTCYGRHLYPEAMMSVFSTSTVSATVSCKNTHSNLEPTYFDTECVRTFKKQELHLERDDFIFCIYPNIIGSQNFTQICTNKSSTLLIEYSTVSVQDCSRTDEFINCSCKRLDSDDSKSGFNWIVDGVHVESKSQYYTSTINGTAVNDIRCIPTDHETLSTSNTDTIAVIVLAVLFAAAVILNFIFYYKCIKNCLSVRDLSQSILNKVNLRSTSKRTKDIANEESEIFLETEKRNHSDNKEEVETEPVTSAVSEFDANIYNVKCSILLIGTKKCNKELYKRTLLRKSYSIVQKKELEQFMWNVLDGETNTLLHTAFEEKVKLPDEKNIHLHYSMRGDTVFKLVDGPVYNDKDVDTFKEEMKSCLVLCREGYNAVVVVYTAEKEKDVSSLMHILNGDFGFNMNNVILVKTKDAKYKEYVAPKEINIKATEINENEIKKENADAIQLEDIPKSTIQPKQRKGDSVFKMSFGDRFIEFDILADYIDNNTFFSLVNEMDKANSMSLFIKHDETLTTNMSLETVLKELSLLLEIISSRKNKHHPKTVLRLTLLQNVWQSYLNTDGDNKNASDNTGIRQNFEKEATHDNNEQKAKPSEKGAVIQMSGVYEDVTYLINCLQNVYFAPQQIKRNEEMLMSHVIKCFRNFNTWYVQRIIRLKDTVLDSNLKMRLSKKKKTHILDKFNPFSSNNG